MSNGVNPHATPIQTPLQNLTNRPSLPAPGTSQGGGPSATPLSHQQRSHSTPKPKQNRQSTSALPAPPLDDVHAAFVEFRAKEEDKVSFLSSILFERITYNYSACLCNVSIANKCVRRTQAVNANICSSALRT